MTHGEHYLVFQGRSTLQDDDIDLFVIQVDPEWLKSRLGDIDWVYARSRPSLTATREHPNNLYDIRAWADRGTWYQHGADLQEPAIEEGWLLVDADTAVEWCDDKDRKGTFGDFLATREEGDVEVELFVISSDGLHFTATPDNMIGWTVVETDEITREELEGVLAQLQGSGAAAPEKG